MRRRGFPCLHGLAEREMKVQAVLGAEIAARELRCHGLDLGRREAIGLQVGQAPVRLTERRLELDAVAIRLDALRPTTGRLQRVSLAHPELWLARVVREQPGIGRDRTLVFAEPRQRAACRLR